MESWQYTTNCIAPGTAVLGTGKIPPFQSRNPAKKPTTLNRTGGENVTVSSLGILFHLTRHAGGHLMIKHVSG